MTKLINIEPTLYSFLRFSLFVNFLPLALMTCCKTPTLFFAKEWLGSMMAETVETLTERLTKIEKTLTDIYQNGFEPNSNQ